MAASAGRLWALYIWNGSAFIAVGGLRTRSFAMNGTLVDVTTADSAGQWRELLAAAGVKSLTIDAAGKFQNDAGAKLALTAVTAQTAITGRLSAYGIQIDCSFMIPSFKSDGAYNEGVDFEIKLESTGQPTITYS